MTALAHDGQAPFELQAEVDAHPFWYHTIDIAPGVSTAGWFDLRPIVDLLPWPEVRGKRCLDIGTFDGYLAFELERRGASEVVAVDVEDHLDWFTAGGAVKGDGFRLAAKLLGSKVDYRECSIYDLNPADLGTFDVVVCGSLLLHLRDPISALRAVRSVTKGLFLSSEQIELLLTIVGRGRPLYRLSGSGADGQWWLANAAGHKRMVEAAGFEIEQVSKAYTVRFNRHPKPAATVSERIRAAGIRAVTGSSAPGVLHRALLARPRA